VRGLVRIVGLSEAPISWPIGERDGSQTLVVYKGLARAVRQETPAVVAASWGVTLATAEQWESACCHPLKRKKQTRTSQPIPWTRSEDELLAYASLADVARLTGRTLTAVRKRRRLLGLPDGRMATTRRVRFEALSGQIQNARSALWQRRSQLEESLGALEETIRRAKTRVWYWQSLVAANTTASDGSAT
jgi:hypothetical protein